MSIEDITDAVHQLLVTEQLDEILRCGYDIDNLREARDAVLQNTNATLEWINLESNDSIIAAEVYDAFEDELLST